MDMGVYRIALRVLFDPHGDHSRVMGDLASRRREHSHSPIVEPSADERKPR